MLEPENEGEFKRVYMYEETIAQLHKNEKERRKIEYYTGMDCFKSDTIGICERVEKNMYIYCSCENSKETRRKP